MNVFFNIIKSYWRVSALVYLLLLLLNVLKPGFVASSINLTVLFLSVLITWIIDITWISKKQNY